MEYTINPPESGPICDFCSDPKVFARYPAKDFQSRQIPDINTVSRGDWSACKTCAELIEASNWVALLERSVATFRAKYGPMLPAVALRNFIRDLHSQFRENRQSLQ